MRYLFCDCVTECFKYQTEAKFYFTYNKQGMLSFTQRLNIVLTSEINH